MSKWPMRKLGEIFEIARGGSPRPIQDFLTDDLGGTNWIMIGDATDSGKYIERTAKRIKPEGARNSRFVSAGDFLLTNSMSFGRPYIMRTDGCIHDGWLHLKKREQNVDDNYFYHLLGSDVVYAKFKRLAAGATVKNLNIDLVSGVDVPLPPLPEQQRIAAILDKADSLRSKRQEAIRLADEFLRAVFADMFGDPAANDKGLPVRLLGDVCRFYAGNSLPRGEPFDGQTDGILHIKVGDMNLPGNETDIHVAREWSSSGAGGIVAPEGAILIPKRGGAIATNKKRVLLRSCALDPNLMAIGPGDELRQEVLLEWFKQFDLTSISSGSAVPQLNKGDLAPLKITVPPLAMQDRFVQVARKVKSMLARQGEQLALIQSASAALTANLLGTGPTND